MKKPPETIKIGSKELEDLNEIMIRRERKMMELKKEIDATDSHFLSSIFV